MKTRYLSRPNLVVELFKGRVKGLARGRDKQGKTVKKGQQGTRVSWIPNAHRKCVW